MREFLDRIFNGHPVVFLPDAYGGQCDAFDLCHAGKAALLQEGIDVEVSQTAGTFVCNHVFYGLMRALAKSRSLQQTRGGFVHVPWLPEQGAPNMTLDDMVRGLSVAVRCALTVQEDRLMGAGATD